MAEALTGRRPFIGRTPAELLTAILHAPFHLSGDAPAVRQVDEVLQRCLAEDRGERFTSVAALQQELIPAFEHCPLFAPTSVTRKAMDTDDVTRGLSTT